MKPTVPLLASMLLVAATGLAQSVTISPTLLPNSTAGQMVDFTFADMPASVTTVQVNVVPPGVTDPAKTTYVYIALVPDVSTYSRTAQGLGIVDAGTYVLGVSTYPAGDPIGTGPAGKGLYKVTVLPADYSKATAAVATQVGAQMVMVNNPYDFDLVANVQVTYKYASGLAGAPPNAIETACACQNPYPLPAGKSTPTAALFGLVGAGDYRVTLTVNLPASAPPDLRGEPTSIAVDKVPSISQSAPVIENNCTASTSGASRTLTVSASSSTFEIDAITVSHPGATGQITGGTQTAQVGTAFATFMAQPSGGQASPVYGAFTIAIPLNLPSVGTLGQSQVKLHNTKGDSNVVTCQ